MALTCHYWQQTHRERNLRIPDTDRLFHKIDAQGLDVVLAVSASRESATMAADWAREDLAYGDCHSLKGSLHVFDHQASLPDL
jgi:hypothetical protein